MLSCLWTWVGALSLRSGRFFWKPGGVTNAAKIMKMINNTNRTSVNGVMLISAITSSSPADETIDIASSPYGPVTRTRAPSSAGRLVEVRRDRRARVVEVQHLGELIGGHDHVLIERLDPRLEVVEENDGDDRDEQARRGRDQRFRNAGR